MRSLRLPSLISHGLLQKKKIQYLTTCLIFWEEREVLEYFEICIIRRWYFCNVTRKHVGLLSVTWELHLWCLSSVAVLCCLLLQLYIFPSPVSSTPFTVLCTDATHQKSFIVLLVSLRMVQGNLSHPTQASHTTTRVLRSNSHSEPPPRHKHIYLKVSSKRESLLVSISKAGAEIHRPQQSFLAWRVKSGNIKTQRLKDSLTLDSNQGIKLHHPWIKDVRS